jgi:hypothetical protein
MKKITIIILTCLTLTSFAQDSIKVQYQFEADRKSRVLNALQGIQFVSVLTSDTLAYNKKFTLYRQTYSEGQVISTDSVIKCEKKQYKIARGNDTINYIVDICDRLRYDPRMDKFEIHLATKLIEDSVRLVLDYPSLSSDEKIVGTESYVFRAIQITAPDRSFYMATNTWMPILAFTPPMKLSSSASSYCLIEGETPEQFYTKHGIAHYYIYYMKIE